VKRNELTQGEDIDGDGRADYCLVEADGDVLCSRNGGVGEKGKWQGFSSANGLRGTVFTGKKGKEDKSGVRLGKQKADFSFTTVVCANDDTIS